MCSSEAVSSPEKPFIFLLWEFSWWWGAGVEISFPGRMWVYWRAFAQRKCPRLSPRWWQLPDEVFSPSDRFPKWLGSFMEDNQPCCHLTPKWDSSKCQVLPIDVLMCRLLWHKTWLGCLWPSEGPRPVAAVLLLIRVTHMLSYYSVYYSTRHVCVCVFQTVSTGVLVCKRMRVCVIASWVDSTESAVRECAVVLNMMS